jgi:hypothetical protein
MTSTPGPTHLSSHHRNTLRKIFQHPTSHNIEWHDVVSLLEAVGSVAPHRDGTIAVTVGSQQGFLDGPEGKDTDIDTIAGLRRMLTAAGYAEANLRDG